MVVRFREIADRSAAEAVTGTELFIDRSALPDDLEADEFYHADLIGLAVRDETGAEIGTVSGFHDFGGGDLMEVTLASGRTVLVPFSAAAVPQVDLDAGVVALDSLAAGLGEEEKTARRPAADNSTRAAGRAARRDAGGNR